MSRRRIRAHIEWKVLIQAPESSGSRRWTRSRISAAALLVKVIARISSGRTPCCVTSQAIRLVITRVLPDPGPARMSRGPSGWVTASRWGSLRPPSSSSALQPTA